MKNLFKEYTCRRDRSTLKKLSNLAHENKVQIKPHAVAARFVYCHFSQISFTLSVNMINDFITVEDEIFIACIVKYWMQSFDVKLPIKVLLTN